GYGSDDDTLYHKFWPADVQLVGKEIIRFHTIYWPILLKALGLPLPKKVFGHGWLVFGGEKMSKSLGNVVDPTVLCERYSSDALRYYLLREITFGADGNFTNESLLTRMNADLSNDLGNLVSRTVAMVEKYFGGDVPVCGALSDLDEALRHTATSLPGAVDTQMEALQYSAALAEIWKLVGDCNQYIDANKPWVLANNEADRPRLGTVLYHLLECIRIVAVLVGPFMPRTPEKIFKQIGLSGGSLGDWESLRSFGRLPAGARVKKGDALFPRFDIQKELTALEALKPAPETKTDPAPEKPPVAMDEFDKIALKVAFVTACEKVPKSDKLLKFTLRVGAEERTVLSGIAGHYEPEALVGKRIVLLSNLQPRMIRGTLSQGMVLSAEGADGTVRLLTVDGEVADGSDIS
ncbi:MAG: methionine--tRNA ligase subunit beta, partial [Clostridia bacterium]|nr:methionine--tRNA ligase subunit beta [Clostridia bacterium]